MISKLIQNGFAYEASGHVLFSVKKFPSYGRLSRKNQKELIAGARVEVAPYKESPEDFVLWKPSTGNLPGWDSPWGRGRPGWHIECSAMSAHYFGEVFDIHAGGIDLIFPHHENERAQSCCAWGVPEMANTWLHNGHLMVNGKKMSKSLGNFFTVRELLQKYNPEAIRLALLSTHYRQPLDWTEDSIEMAKLILSKWYRIIEKFFSHDFFTNELARQTFFEKNEKSVEDASTDFFSELFDDMNTPAAIQAFSKKIKLLEDQKGSEKVDLCLADVLYCSEAIGLLFQTPNDWFRYGCTISDAEISEKIKRREIARKNNDFALSDSIRSELLKQGIQIEDSVDGTRWRRM